MNLPRLLVSSLVAGFIAFACATLARAKAVSVQAGDNLQAKIDAAQGGDVLELATGDYQGFKLHDRHFSAAAPLVIRSAPGAHPVIRSKGYDEDHLAEMSRSSYVVLDGIEMIGGNRPIYCQDVDHFIFINLTVHDTGQEIIHIRGSSRFVDVRDCRLYDTGHKHPQWSEGVYVGQGSPPFENVEQVWIEGNDISRTGNSEGVNIKCRSYHVTVRGNKIHDIAPGTATQYNESAISCEAADLGFNPGVDPDIWIEDNEVFRVSYGRWANGIQPTTMGPRVVHNHIHDCEQFGIEFNDYLAGPGMFPTILWENTIENCRDGAFNSTVMPHASRDPGPNPNRPQAWYATPPPPG